MSSRVHMACFFCLKNEQTAVLLNVFCMKNEQPAVLLNVAALVLL
jgi:hypothetical protein